MDQKFAIIGLGSFGLSLARTLANDGAQVIAIDNDEEKIDAIREEVAYAIVMDATNDEVLKSQNIHEVDAAVVAIGEDFESLLLSTAHLIDLEVPRIIARANNHTQKTILQKIGVTEIVSPEEDVGLTIANKLLNPSFINFVPLPDDYEIVEVITPQNIAGRTVGDVELRQRYNLNLITVKREKSREMRDGQEEKEYRVIGVPTPKTELHPEDTLILMGQSDDVNRFLEINK
jgi:trk system potassium uptake protein TrkA